MIKNAKHKPSWFHCATAIALSLLLVSCTASVHAKPAKPTPESAPALAPSRQPAAARKTSASASQGATSNAAIATASNSFGFNLLHQLHEAAPHENIFISPLSLSLMLQMAYNGADGQTAEEIAQVLQVEGMELPTMNEASRALQEALAARVDVELLLGNSIWLQQGYELIEPFVDTVGAIFNAEIDTLDFASPEAVDRINDWVASATNHKIPRLFEMLDTEAISYLINTVYFKGAWNKPFDPARTKAALFYLADGSEISVPMMTQEGKFTLARGEEYAALALPYGDTLGDDQVRMVIVLPDEGVELASVLAQLTPEAWQSLAAELESERRAIVSLPRFTMEYDATLNDALRALGMERAFAQPNFANMMEGGGLSLSYVRHKAIVEISEEGTEAAAVSVGTTRLSMPPTFIVNRPFFFAIQETKTGALLFMGAVHVPQTLAE